MRLARDGYAVGVGYAQGTDEARASVEATREAGGRAEAFQVDVADAGSVERFFEAGVVAFGPLRCLVANAAILGDERCVDEQDPEALRRLLHVNVLGPLLCARAAIRRLSTCHGGEGGAIVLLGSVAAHLGGLPDLVPYVATKGAVETLVRGLSNEVAGESIRVTGVAPGVIRIDMTSPDAEAASRHGTPMGRIGQPQEVAEAVAWPVSPAASYVSGTTITVSGGR